MHVTVKHNSGFYKRKTSELTRASVFHEQSTFSRYPIHLSSFQNIQNESNANKTSTGALQLQGTFFRAITMTMNMMYSDRCNLPSRLLNETPLCLSLANKINQLDHNKGPVGHLGTSNALWQNVACPQLQMINFLVTEMQVFLST